MTRHKVATIPINSKLKENIQKYFDAGCIFTDIIELNSTHEILLIFVVTDNPYIPEENFDEKKIILEIEELIAQEEKILWNRFVTWIKKLFSHGKSS
jgi:hypothetical protein